MAEGGDTADRAPESRLTRVVRGWPLLVAVGACERVADGEAERTERAETVRRNERSAVLGLRDLGMSIERTEEAVYVDLPPTARKSEMGLGAQILITEEENAVIRHRPAEGRESLRVGVASEIDPMDLRTEAHGEWAEIEAPGVCGRFDGDGHVGLLPNSHG